MLLFLIAAGGGAGAVARYLVGVWVQGWAGAAFPWGTLGVNLLGCLLLGGAMRVMEGAAASPEVRGLVTVGFLGAFTTFSTFSLEAVVLLQRGEWLRAAAYVGASVVFGLAGLALGMGGLSGAR
jgi:fluoride exporter